VTERLSRAEALLPDTRELLDEIKRCTGVPVLIRESMELHGRARATYVASDADRSRHLLLYDPEYARFLDHLVAHECGHIVRFACAGREDQKIAVMSRNVALPGIERDIDHLAVSGVPIPAIREMITLWLAGTVSQLHNGPADIHIERWVHREFPGLRAAQEASLLDQAAELHRVLEPGIWQMTPTTVWRAANAMNYAFLKAVGQLLNQPDLLKPYARSGVKTAGEDLYRIVDETPDSGLAHDQALSERWAERLGFAGWLDWRHLDDLPAGFRRWWE
jgi:hypothetical protein